MRIHNKTIKAIETQEAFFRSIGQTDHANGLGMALSIIRAQTSRKAYVPADPVAIQEKRRAALVKARAAKAAARMAQAA